MPPGGFSGGGILFSTVVAKVLAEDRVVVEEAVSEGFAPIDDRNFHANNTAAISTTTAALQRIQRREAAAWFLALMLRIACFLSECVKGHHQPGGTISGGER
jgi:hypothetical protein